MDFVVYCAQLEIRDTKTGITLDLSILKDYSPGKTNRQGNQIGQDKIDELLYADIEKVLPRSCQVIKNPLL